MALLADKNIKQNPSHFWLAKKCTCKIRHTLSLQKNAQANLPRHYIRRKQEAVRTLVFDISWWVFSKFSLEIYAIMQESSSLFTNIVQSLRKKHVLIHKMIIFCHILSDSWKKVHLRPQYHIFDVRNVIQDCSFFFHGTVSLVLLYRFFCKEHSLFWSKYCSNMPNLLEHLKGASFKGTVWHLLYVKSCCVRFGNVLLAIF